ncbi:MAG: hypothetical protein HY540_00055 [Deltaproteobacteria bacterium]|nr:hypothetical protein [Deltaproteobacteria bacterium]
MHGDIPLGGVKFEMKEKHGLGALNNDKRDFRRSFMTLKMTWEEMKKAYPDEWLLIVDYEKDDSGHLIAGIVSCHSKDKTEVFNFPTQLKGGAFKYTGESTFPSGWRSYAERHCF